MDATHTLLMTGAGRGIGRAAAEHLLRADPSLHLVLTARRGDGAPLAAELASASGNRHVTALGCDLADLGQVRALAARLEELLAAGTVPPLRKVLLAAGVQAASTTSATVDGIETAWAVNVAANYLLLRRVAPMITGTGEIVVVASDTHFGDLRHNLGLVPGPVWSDPRTLAQPGGPGATTTRAGRRAYATSKLAVIHLVHAFAERLPPEVAVFSYNPGLVPGTGIAREGGALERLVWARLMPALTVLPGLAASPAAAGALLAATIAGPRPAESGAYLDRGRPALSSAESFDPSREDALWDALAELVDLPAAV